LHLPWALFALVVGQPFSNKPDPLPDVRSTDARSAEIDRPAGVTRSFQVSLYKVEPAKAVFARNLFTINSGGLPLGDKVEECWP
jgi:hypothetical protein